MDTECKVSGGNMNRSYVIYQEQRSLTSVHAQQKTLEIVHSDEFGKFPVRLLGGAINFDSYSKFTLTNRMI